VAATAKRHELVVMTRNVGLFAPFNVEVFNPWAEKQEVEYDFGEEPEERFSQAGSTSAELSLPRGAGDGASSGWGEEGEAA
jgi:hypothetical protein